MRSYESHINAEINSRNMRALFVATQILATPLQLLGMRRVQVPKEASDKGSCHTYEDWPGLIHRDKATVASAPSAVIVTPRPLCPNGPVAGLILPCPAVHV